MVIGSAAVTLQLRVVDLDFRTDVEPADFTLLQWLLWASELTFWTLWIVSLVSILRRELLAHLLWLGSAAGFLTSPYRQVGAPLSEIAEDRPSAAADPPARRDATPE